MDAFDLAKKMKLKKNGPSSPIAVSPTDSSTSDGYDASLNRKFYVIYHVILFSTHSSNFPFDVELKLVHRTE